MSRLVNALVAALITAAATLIIVWCIALLIGSPVSDVLRSPEVWVVEGSAVAVAAAVALRRSKDTPDSGTEAGPSTLRVVVTRLAVATAIALGIGALLALATGTPVLQVWSSVEFLITATVAVGAAVLEGWPSAPHNED